MDEEMEVLLGNFAHFRDENAKLKAELAALRAALESLKVWPGRAAELANERDRARAAATRWRDALAGMACQNPQRVLAPWIPEKYVHCGQCETCQARADKEGQGGQPTA